MEELVRLWNDITSYSSWLGGHFNRRDQDSSLPLETAGSADVIQQQQQQDDLVSLDAPRHRHRRQLGNYSAMYDLSQDVIRCHVSFEKEVMESSSLSPLTCPPTPPSPLLSPPAAPQSSIIQPMLPILRRIPYMPAIQEGPPEAEISVAYMSDQTEVSVVRHMAVSPWPQEEDEVEGEVDIAEIDLPPIDSLPLPSLSTFNRPFRGHVDQAGSHLEENYGDSDDDEVLMSGEDHEGHVKAATRIKEENKDERIEESEEDDDEGGVDGGDSISLPDIVPFS
eukprot:scaffold461_cov157-Ochromonas_danica.AAC.4